MIGLLAIDPGQYTGWALIDVPARRLLAAGCVTPDEDIQCPIAFDSVVIEMPARNYGRGAQDKSLFKLAYTAGRYGERYRHTRIELVEPRAWKGTIDPDIMCDRIEAALTPEERALLPRVAESYRHNMLDAIGIAKWAVRQPFVRPIK